MSASGPKHPLKMVFAISSRGIAITTRFEDADGPTNYSTGHVRRSRNAAMAGIARSPSETIPAVVRDAFDVSGHADTGLRRGIVRTPDHCHQHHLSLYGARAACRNRHRGGCPAGTDEARFRPRD